MAERITTLPNPEQLVVDQTQILERFFGQEAIPEPPKALLEFVERTAELGFTFEPYFEPRVQFSQDSNYPGWHVKPVTWLYDQIKRGNVSPDAITLSGNWAAMEAIQKPEYDGGKQLYENDPLAPILEKLRNDGKIAVPNWCRHIPSTSRFGVSHDEITKCIVPEFATMAQIEAEQASVPPYTTFNFRGNIAHPEWGETNTWEWFADSFEDDYRLVGGDSGRGGLADVYYDWSGNRGGRVAFRLRVVSPS